MTISNVMNVIKQLTCSGRHEVYHKDTRSELLWPSQHDKGCKSMHQTMKN